MDNKSHIAVKKLFFSFYTDREAITNFDDAKEEQLHADLSELAEKHGLRFHDSYTSFLNLEKYSIDECAHCGNLAVDRATNPAGISDQESDIDWAISDGAILDGILLCENCLPSNHRWGHDF